MSKKAKTLRLFNLVDKKVLKQVYLQDRRPRITLSFYNYYPIVPSSYLGQIREDLYRDLEAIEVLGRIYLSSEGINAQVSVLEDRFPTFRKILGDYPFLRSISLNEAVEEDPEKFSFYKLIVRIRRKIVADGLGKDLDFSSPESRGASLTPEEFHKVLESGEALPVDVRNHYESEVGRFKGALTVDCDTFRQQLPMLAEELKDYKDKKLLLYCTGGIRCEKAGAYLKQNGYPEVYQLKGGIIAYAKYIKKHNLPGHFLGKNFVFDGRMGERITDDVIARCHQCGIPCDDHTNCANDACHLLFIQCPGCREKFEGCCSRPCREIIHLPLEEQRNIRRQGQKIDSLSVYKSRIRPRLHPDLEEIDENLEEDLRSTSVVSGEFPQSQANEKGKK